MKAGQVVNSGTAPGRPADRKVNAWAEMHILSIVSFLGLSYGSMFVDGFPWRFCFCDELNVRQ